MKINRVKCDQFAGLHDIDVEFSDGLNLLIGENESGKSTLTDLIFRILFKDTKVDRRKDADFIDCYFPQKINGPQGDVIDGTLIFSTKNGIYKLWKEWVKGKGISRLTTPDRTGIKNTDEIARILSEELGYKEGVFDEIIFASQKRNQNAIESIMKALPGKKDVVLKDTRDNLTSTLTQAVLETGGVSLEKIEQRLQGIVSSYESHWDQDADTPEGGKRRGINNKWKKDVGKILAAYYEMEETREAQKSAETAEKDVEDCQKRMKEFQDHKKLLEGQLHEFWKHKAQLEKAASLKEKIDRDEADIKRMQPVLEDWPRQEENQRQAIKLQKQLNCVTVANRYKDVKEARDKFEAKKSEIDKLQKITKEDVSAVAQSIRNKEITEAKLSGLNLTARIRQLGDLPIEVRNIASGAIIPSSDGKYSIDESVEITIPDVMELQLTPGDIDVDQIREEIRSANEDIQKRYEQYNVSSIDDLRKKQEEYVTAHSEFNEADKDLDRILHGETWEDIKAEYDAIDIELMPEDELKKSIRILCGSKSIDSYLGAVESTLDNYKKAYRTKEYLSEHIRQTEDAIKENKRKRQELDDIPEEYREIAEPEKYEKELTAQIDKYEEDYNDENIKFQEAVKGLGDRTAEDYSEDLLEKETAFAARKSEYNHWKNISEVFYRMKGQLGGNHIGDIETKFKEYLSIISGGNIELQSMDEKMSVNLSSGNNKLSYDILSNGTKDTISLAFRLAMLEHLYPEGDGLAVFDDSFTEMDPKRVQQSCRLIEKFAKKNQVIFITCDNKYTELMRSNKIINMSN